MTTLGDRDQIKEFSPNPLSLSMRSQGSVLSIGFIFGKLFPILFGTHNNITTNTPPSILHSLCFRKCPQRNNSFKTNTKITLLGFHSISYMLHHNHVPTSQGRIILGVVKVSPFDGSNLWCPRCASVHIKRSTLRDSLSSEDKETCSKFSGTPNKQDFKAINEKSLRVQWGNIVTRIKESYYNNFPLFHICLGRIVVR